MSAEGRSRTEWFTRRSVHSRSECLCDRDWQTRRGSVESDPVFVKSARSEPELADTSPEPDRFRPKNVPHGGGLGLAGSFAGVNGIASVISLASDIPSENVTADRLTQHEATRTPSTPATLVSSARTSTPIHVPTPAMSPRSEGIGTAAPCISTLQQHSAKCWSRLSAGSRSHPTLSSRSNSGHSFSISFSAARSLRRGLCPCSSGSIGPP